MLYTKLSRLISLAAFFFLASSWAAPLTEGQLTAIELLSPLVVKVNKDEGYKLQQEATKAYQERVKLVTEYIEKQPELYGTPQGQAFMRQMITNLGNYARGSSVIVLYDKNHVEKHLSIPEASSSDALAQLFFKQSCANSNIGGIKFFAGNYKVDTTNALHAEASLSKQQTAATPIQALRALCAFGAHKQQINMWDARGETPMHRAAHQVVKNYQGLKQADKSFSNQLIAGKIQLAPGMSKAQALREWLAVREEALKSQSDLIVEYKKLGGRDLPNKDGKRVSEILQICKDEEGPCKSAYEALLAVTITKAAQTQALAASAAAVTTAGAVSYLPAVKKIAVATVIIGVAGYFVKKAYDSYRKYRDQE